MNNMTTSGGPIVLRCFKACWQVASRSQKSERSVPKHTNCVEVSGGLMLPAIFELCQIQNMAIVLGVV